VGGFVVQVLHAVLEQQEEEGAVEDHFDALDYVVVGAVPTDTKVAVGAEHPRGVPRSTLDGTWTGGSTGSSTNSGCWSTSSSTTSQTQSELEETKLNDRDLEEYLQATHEVDTCFHSLPGRWFGV